MHEFSNVMSANGVYAARRRKKHARAVLSWVLCILTFAVLWLAVMLFVRYLTSPARHIPPLDEVLAMSDEEAAAALSDFTEEHIREAWGEPWSESDYAYGYVDDRPTRYLLYKEPDGLDHLELYFSNETGQIIAAEVWQVFKAYSVFSDSDLLWGTVTPLPNEEEAALGDLVEINYRSSRPAVIEYLEPMIPVIIYYKGEPKPADETHRFPYIDTVWEMHYYDYTLEPIEFEGEK